MTAKQQRITTAAFFFLSGILTATWSSRIADVQEALELNNAQWGRILVCLPVGLVAGLAISSPLIARFGTRRMMIASALLFSIALCLISLSDGPVKLMGALLFTGLTRTIMNIAVNTRSAQVQQLYTRPIISTFHGIWSVACLLAGIFGGWMIVSGVSVTAHFWGVAAVGLAAAIFLGRTLPKESLSAPQRRPFLIRPDRFLLHLGAIAFCGMMAENVMFDWSVNYFEKTIGAGESWLTAGLNAFIIAMSVGRLTGDWLTHRFGATNMLIFNGVLMAAGFALAAIFPQVAPAVGGFLLIGLGNSIVVPVVYALAARSTKMSAAYAIASVALMGATGFIVAPLLVGTLSEALGMRWAIAVVGSLGLVISLIAARTGRFSEIKNASAEEAL